jgi:hypothetical protein
VNTFVTCTRIEDERLNYFRRSKQSLAADEHENDNDDNENVDPAASWDRESGRMNKLQIRWLFLTTSPLISHYDDMQSRLT